jgi:hypothetical protein
LVLESLCIIDGIVGCILGARGGSSNRWSIIPLPLAPSLAAAASPCKVVVKRGASDEAIEHCRIIKAKGCSNGLLTACPAERNELKKKGMPAEQYPWIRSPVLKQRDEDKQLINIGR